MARTKSPQRKTAYQLGLNAKIIKRKLWLARKICGLTNLSLTRLIGRYLYHRIYVLGRRPRPRQWFRLCACFGLEPEDFILSESVLVAKLQKWRREYVEQRKQSPGSRHKAPGRRSRRTRSSGVGE